MDENKRPLHLQEERLLDDSRFYDTIVTAETLPTPDLKSKS